MSKTREQKLEAALRNLLAYHIAPTNGQTPFAKAINEARQALAEPSEEWISVDVELPPEGRDVLVSSSLSNWVTIAHRIGAPGTEEGITWYEKDGTDHYNIAHWMPLPKKPAAPKPETK